jgi:phage shock protein A
VPLDPAALQPQLDAIAEQLAECRAAAATAAEGDPTALTELSETVDAMAGAVARLKAAVSAPALGDPP